MSRQNTAGTKKAGAPTSPQRERGMPNRRKSPPADMETAEQGAAETQIAPKGHSKTRQKEANLKCRKRERPRPHNPHPKHNTPGKQIGQQQGRAKTKARRQAEASAIDGHHNLNLKATAQEELPHPKRPGGQTGRSKAWANTRRRGNEGHKRSQGRSHHAGSTRPPQATTRTKKP